MQVFLPNLMFDDTLAGRRSPPAGRLREVLSTLNPLIGLAADPGDAVIADPKPVRTSDVLAHVRWMSLEELDSLPADIRLIPWGWDAPAYALAARFPDSPAPLPEVVRQVNSRRFQSAFDTVIRSPEPGGPDDDRGQAAHRRSPEPGRRFSFPCDNEQDITAALTRLHSTGIVEWIGKAEFSASGRHRIRGRGTTVSDSQKRWLRRQWESGCCVSVEPAVTITRECGLLFEIDTGSGGHCSESVRFLGTTDLYTDRRGQYSGSRITHDVPPVWQPAVRHGRQVARAAADLGYFGPLGIDAMEFIGPDGIPLLRPCHDINARLTMGFLARRLLPLIEPHEQGFWLHRRSEETGLNEQGNGIFSAFPPAQIVRTVSTGFEFPQRPSAAIDTELVITSLSFRAESADAARPFSARG